MGNTSKSSSTEFKLKVRILWSKSNVRRLSVTGVAQITYDYECDCEGEINIINIFKLVLFNQPLSVRG